MLLEQPERPYSLGTRRLLWFGHECCDLQTRMLSWFGHGCFCRNPYAQVPGAPGHLAKAEPNNWGYLGMWHLRLKDRCCASL